MHITNFAVNRTNQRRASASDIGVLNDTKWSLSDLRSVARTPISSGRSALLQSNSSWLPSMMLIAMRCYARPSPCWHQCSGSIRLLIDRGCRIMCTVQQTLPYLMCSRLGQHLMTAPATRLHCNWQSNQHSSRPCVPRQSHIICE